MKSTPYFIFLFLFGICACDHKSENNDVLPSDQFQTHSIFIIDSLDFNLEDSLHSRALHVVSENEIYFGSYGGRLIHLKISPEETNILHLNTPKNLEDIRGIVKIDSNVMAINSGDRGLIFSVNGWEHSIKHEYSENTFLNGIQFWDKQKGIVFGDPINDSLTLAYTEDGGKTWSRLQGFPTLTNEAGFSASNTAMKTGRNGQVWIGTGGDSVARLHYSSDFGKSWVTKNTPIQSNASSGIFSLYFEDQRGIIVGGNYLEENDTNKISAYTEDNGETWTLGQGMRGYRSCVASNGKVVFATGRNGVDYSLDFGKTWKPLFNKPFYTVDVKDNFAWFIGKEGTVRRIQFELD